MLPTGCCLLAPHCRITWPNCGPCSTSSYQTSLTTLTGECHLEMIIVSYPGYFSFPSCGLGMRLQLHTYIALGFRYLSVADSNVLAISSWPYVHCPSIFYITMWPYQCTFCFPPAHASFQSWFDFDSAGVDEAREKIIAQEREQHVLSTLHQVQLMLCT